MPLYSSLGDERPCLKGGKKTDKLKLNAKKNSNNPKEDKKEEIGILKTENKY